MQMIKENNNRNGQNGLFKQLHFPFSFCGVNGIFVMNDNNTATKDKRVANKIGREMNNVVQPIIQSSGRLPLQLS